MERKRERGRGREKMRGGRRERERETEGQRTRERTLYVQSEGRRIGEKKRGRFEVSHQPVAAFFLISVMCMYVYTYT